MNLKILWAAVFLWVSSLPALAACSRPILVPVATIGQSVIVDGDVVSGVYPEVLREIGQKGGCVFQFKGFPRARSDLMFFEQGTSDIVIPASFVPERAQAATFIPLIKVLPTLVAVKPLTKPMHSVAQLLADSSLRGVVVRSFTFGKEYQALITALEQQGRLDYTSDLASVARMLVVGRVDFTIVPPHLMRVPLDAAVLEERKPDVSLMSYPLDGLPRIESGLYISKRALSEQDQQTLKTLFTSAAKADAFVKGHQKYYPTEILKGVVTRP